MNRQQEYLFKMLGEIHDLCTKNGITYYIAMGTLIGAVRHGGFLPWDDDADIFMTYDEFQRFKKVCAEQLPPNRHLSAPDVDERCGNMLPRYVSCDTTAIHTCQSLHDDVAGEVIDIFLLDPIADGDGVHEAYVQDMMLYSSIVNYANVSAKRFEIDAQRFREFRELERERGRAHVVARLEELLASHFAEDGSRYAFRWMGVPICLERSWFEEAVPIEFEGVQLLAPKGINEFLTCYYGEGWVDIPGRINPSKHDTAGSLDFPYTQALEYYRPTHDRAKLLADLDKRKYQHFKAAPASNALVDERARAYATVAQIETAKLLEGRRDELETAAGTRDTRTLVQLLAPYLAAQTSADLLGRYHTKGMYRFERPLLVDVDDTVFEAALVALLESGRMHHARRIIDVRTATGLPLTQPMAAVRDDIMLFHEAMNDYQYGRLNEGLEKVRMLTERHPEVAEFRKHECALLAAVHERSGAAEDLEALQAVANVAQERFEGDGFFMKVQADCLRARGEEERAAGLYLEAAERTRNGLAIRDIAAKTGYYPGWLRDPAWAKAAGVPQWNGPEPSKPQAAPYAPDALQEALLALLARLATYCDARGVRYVLAPAVAKALFGEGKLPGRIAQYRIVCPPSDYIALRGMLLEDPPEGCACEHAGNSARVTGRELRLHDAGTLALEFGTDEPTPFNSLYVNVLPLEPKRYGGPGGAMLARAEADGSAPRPHGRREFAYALQNGMWPRCTAAKLEQTVLCADKLEAGQKRFVNRGAKPLRMASDFLLQTQVREYGGTEFKVPADLDAYLKLAPKRAGAGALKRGKETVYSASVGYDELVAAGGFDPGYHARRKAVREQTAFARQVASRFNENFEEIREAVARKQQEIDGAA